MVFKTGISGLPASVNVQLQVPSQPKLGRHNEVEGRIAHEFVLSSNDCSALVEQLQDNLRHAEIMVTSKMQIRSHWKRQEEDYNFPTERGLCYTKDKEKPFVL